MFNSGFQLFSFFFGCAARRILLPPAGIEPVPLQWKRKSLNHWTAREVPQLFSSKLSLLQSGGEFLTHRLLDGFL